MGVVAVPRSDVVGEGQEPVLRDFHCHGCGRRLLQYTPDEFGPRSMIRVRCRDSRCKTTNELRGADVARLLHAISHGGRDGT